MRYVIFHTPRTGSNVLCDALVSTGVAGMTSLDSAGFFIGYGKEVRHAWENGAVDRYFEDHQTANGVQGCKLGWDYIEHLNKVLPFGAVDEILESFDYYFLLTRRDKVAQAVSRLIARSTGEWTSEDHKNPRQKILEPTYDPNRIAYFIAQHAGHERALQAWAWQKGIYLANYTYEKNAEDWTAVVMCMFAYMGIEWDGKEVTLTLEKQNDPRKAEWVSRYKIW